MCFTTENFIGRQHQMRFGDWVKSDSADNKRERRSRSDVVFSGATRIDLISPRLSPQHKAGRLCRREQNHIGSQKYFKAAQFLRHNNLIFFFSVLAQKVTNTKLNRCNSPAVKAADVKASLYDRGEQTRQWDKEEPCEIRRRADRRSAWILSGGKSTVCRS